MVSEEQLDNILVKQKDKIINLIDSGQEMEAIYCLVVLKELWYASQYDYKWIELKARIEQALKLEDEDCPAIQIIRNHFNELLK